VAALDISNEQQVVQSLIREALECVRHFTDGEQKALPLGVKVALVNAAHQSFRRCEQEAESFAEVLLSCAAIFNVKLFSSQVVGVESKEDATRQYAVRTKANDLMLDADFDSRARALSARAPAEIVAELELLVCDERKTGLGPQGHHLLATMFNPDTRRAVASYIANLGFQSIWERLTIAVIGLAKLQARMQAQVAVGEEMAQRLPDLCALLLASRNCHDRLSTGT